MAYPTEVLRAVARGDRVAGSEVTPGVVDSAIEHRMAALLLGAVEDQGDIPASAAATLVAYDMAVAARRRQQDHVFEYVHDRLEAAGVTHTFVKGPVSARRWFEVPTDRPYSDIDVVVPSGPPLMAAVKALQPEHPVLRVLGSEGTSPGTSSVVVEVEGVQVDLQTDALRSGLTPNSYQSWSIGTDFLADGRRIFDAEHDLVIFLLHQGRDRFRFLLGAAEARRRLLVPVDWERMAAISRREGFWEQIAVVLEVMCEETGMKMPVEVPRNWRTGLWRALWRPKVRFLGEVGRFRHVIRGRWLMPFTMRGGSVKATRWMIQSMFPPDEVLRLRYPDSEGPYLWRVFWLRANVFGRRRFRVWRAKAAE